MIRVAKKSNTDKIEFFIISFYILWKLPFFSMYINTYFAMILLVVLCVYLTFKNKNLIYKTPKVLVTTIIYLFFLLIDRFIFGEKSIIVLWSIFLDVLPLYIGCILVFKNDSVILKKIPKVIIPMYFITSITTLIGLFYFPGASREMAANSEAYLKYFKYNIGGFDFIYSLALTHPIFIFYLRSKGKNVLSIIYSIAVLLCIVKSEYTIALIVCCLSFIVYFLKINGEKKIRIKGSTIVFLIIFLIFMFVGVENRLFGESLNKINDIFNLFQGKELNAEDSSIRLALYSNSISGFLDSIIIGNKLFNSNIAGGHSFFFDLLANWGLFGVILVVPLFITIYKESLKISKKDTNVSGVIKLFFLIFLILICLNPKAWIYEIGFVAPVFWSILSKTKKTEGGDDESINFSLSNN